MRVIIFDTKYFEVTMTTLQFYAAGDNEIICVNADLHRLFENAMSDEMSSYHWLIDDRPGPSARAVAGTTGGSVLDFDH